jgi:uncharacterized protein (DUF952 family)
MAANDAADKDWSRVATGEALHLVPEPHWRAHDGADRYAPEPFAEEGFIHTTHGEDRLIEVANRYYAGDPRPYLALTIDLARVDAPVIYEDPDDAFPHVYGHLPMNAVVAVRRVQRDPDGPFVAIGDDAAAAPRG